jgi:hypothetical protein
MSLEFLNFFSLLLNLLDFQIELVEGFPFLPELSVLGAFSFVSHPA